MIDVNAQFNNFAQVYQGMEELCKEMEDRWAKLASPLEQIIQVHNNTQKGLKERDRMISQQEDVMDRRVVANWVKVTELQAQVTGILYSSYRMLILVNRYNYLRLSWCQGCKACLLFIPLEGQ